LGAAARVNGGWQLTNVFVPANSTLRARGFVTGGYHNGCSYLVESTLLLSEILPVIIVNDGSFGICSNQFGFNVRAIPGQAVVIEASTDLMNWVSIQTNVVTASGFFYFTDPESGLFPRRFYRARLYTGLLPPPTIRADGAMGFQAGQFGFDLTGIAGQAVVIEASTNLLNWAAISTNTLGSSPLYFNDPASTTVPVRFYRARLEARENVQDALDAYAEVVEDYPETPAAQDARKSLESLRTQVQ
jgi:hypothetical protein